MNPGVTRPQRKGTGKNGRQAPQPSHQLATRVEGDEAELDTEQKETPAQNPEPKPPSTPTKPKFSRKTRLAKDVKNRRGSGSCHNLNMTEAIAPKAGDQVNRHPGHLNRGETTGRSSRPRGTPEYLHKWKPPFQPGGNKSTLRKQDPQAESWEPGKEKVCFRFHAC